MSITQSSDAPADVDQALALAAAGRLREAIACACAALRRRRDGALESKLAEWRHQAFEASAIESAPSWPPRADDPFVGCEGIPEIAAGSLSLDTLAGGILHHGCVLVRGLMSADEAAQFADGIDRAIACRDGQASDAMRDEAWYRPLPLPETSELPEARVFVASGGGLWAADSPRLLFDLIELCRRKGLIDLIGDYFGERPAMSVGKTTLRRVPATLAATDWHQDGAFLGEAVRSVNLWIALTRCGRDAPGLDLIPGRMQRILPTGTHGACFHWAVGQGMVDSILGDVPIASPEFMAGDALLFDHYFLHRTSLPAGMIRDRHAIESWFFAPSAYPADQEPLLL